MDSVVGLPLRIGADGRLVRGEPVETLMRLFRAMAATPASAWPHAPWFGLQEVFAAANVWLEDQPALTDALNDALGGLGVQWVRVDRVHTAPSTVPGERTFHVVLVDAAGAATHAVLEA